MHRFLSFSILLRFVCSQETWDEFNSWSGWNVKKKNQKGQASKSTDKGVMAQIPHLTLDFPLFDETDSDAEVEKMGWIFTGAAVPTTKNAILLPDVPERYGGVWASNPFHATTFAATFQFSIHPSDTKAQANQPVSDLGWGIYFLNAEDQPIPNPGKVLVNRPKNIPVASHLKSKGFGFYGMPSKWSGFGVVFRSFVNGKWNPTVSIVPNHSNETDYGVTQVPLKQKGYKQLDIRNDQEPMDGLIRLQLNGSTIRVVGYLAPRSKVAEQIKFEEWGRMSVPICNQWHVGFSGLTSHNPHEKTHSVRILGMRILSDDPTANEDVMKDLEDQAKRAKEKRERTATTTPKPTEVATKKGGTKKTASSTTPIPAKSKELLKDMEEEEKMAQKLREDTIKLVNRDRPLDIKEQSAWVEECTKVVETFIKHQKHSERITSRSFSLVLNQIHRVSSQAHKLMKEVNMVMGKKKGGDVTEHLKRHLSGLKKSIQKHSAETDSILNVVDNTALNINSDNKDEEEMKMQYAKNLHDKVSEQVNQTTSRLFYMMLLIVMLSLSCLIVVYRKLKSHEKKHFL